MEGSLKAFTATGNPLQNLFVEQFQKMKNKKNILKNENMELKRQLEDSKQVIFNLQQKIKAHEETESNYQKDHKIFMANLQRMRQHIDSKESMDRIFSMKDDGDDDLMIISDNKYDNDSAQTTKLWVNNDPFHWDVKLAQFSFTLFSPVVFSECDLI